MTRILLFIGLVALVACDTATTENVNLNERPEDGTPTDARFQGIPEDGTPAPPPTTPSSPTPETPPEGADPGGTDPAPPVPPTSLPADTAGSVGAACGAATECDGPAAVCLNLPGGYCAISGCGEGGNTCPDGSTCFAFQDGDSYCIETCGSSSDCRQTEGYVCDQDGTCWPGPDASSTPAGGGGNSPVGGPCQGDSDCADTGASCYPYMLNGQATGFVNGYCLINQCTAGSCPAGSTCTEIYADGGTACVAECGSTTECRDTEGYTCFEPGICFPGCGPQSTCPEGLGCGVDGTCEPACTPETCGPDLVCAPSGLCEEAPCTATSCPAGLSCAASGKCVPDLSGGPGAGPGPSCSNLPPKACTGTQAYCAEIIPFEPVEGPGYVNYPLNGETWSNQYRSYARRDLVMLVQWASAYVGCKAGTWEGGNGYPLGMGDMSEVNGDIPGTSDGSPGHPAGTHVDGYDIDIAYYQNEQTGPPNNYLRSICDHVVGGADQYHCVSEPYMLDVWRSALFIGALFSSNRTRVIGVDGKAGALISQALEVLCAEGWVPSAGCLPQNQSLACEVEDNNGGLCWKENGSGWFHFHHHHMHLSLWQLASSNSSMQAPKQCFDAPCSDMSQEMDFMREAGHPGLVRTMNTPAKEPMLPWSDATPIP